MVRMRRRSRRAVTPIIASVLLAGITIAAGVILWTLRVNLPASPVSITYVAVGDQSEPAWGDPTDCLNYTSLNATCGVLPAIFLVITGHQPESIPLNALLVDFQCNGTSLLNGTLNNLEIIPGTGQNPSASSPKLGHCGTWTPSSKGTHATYFNRLMYYQQINPGSPIVHVGDVIVIYAHPPLQFTDHAGNQGDSDDYHGSPPWCFTVPGACQLTITYVQNPPVLVAVIPLTQLGR